MTELNAVLNPQGKRVAIVAARFNNAIVDPLLAGAVETLQRHGISDDNITVVRCPGAWELPLLCKRFADKNYDAVVALGCVIRGDTAHFDYVAGEAAKGIGRVSLESNKPVIFGVLTTDTVEQAQNRAGLKLGNKGSEAAMAALEMIAALDAIEANG